MAKKPKTTDEFALYLTLGNDAMQTPDDVAGALRGVIRRVLRGDKDGIIKDVNGNTVGSWEQGEAGTTST
jgi:hypothetical protein